MIDRKKIDGHTPGPLTVDRDGDVVDRLARVIVRDGVLRPADAELFAAAPELYAFWLANQWQPIETAPRDGLYFEAVGTDGMVFTCASDEAGAWRWPATGTSARPTHWRPLPALPGGRRMTPRDNLNAARGVIVALALGFVAIALCSYSVAP